MLIFIYFTVVLDCFMILGQLSEFLYERYDFKHAVGHKKTPGAGEHTGVQVMRTALHNWRAQIYA